MVTFFNRRLTDRLSPKQLLQHDANGLPIPQLVAFELDNGSLKLITEVTRTIVAFANTQGGLIVIGAKKQLSAPPQLIGATAKEISRIHKKLGEMIATNIQPSLEVTIWRLPVKNQPNKEVLSLMVPASRACPHVVVSENAIYVFEQTAVQASIDVVESLFERKLIRRHLLPSRQQGDRSVDLTEEELKALLS